MQDGLSRRSFTGAAATALAACATKPASNYGDAIADYIERITAFGFTGAIWIERDNHTLAARGCGYADRSEARPFTRETIFNFASFSKTITATAAMKLIESGQLALDHTIARYAPSAPPDKADITIAHLLSHSAGLTRDSVRNQAMSGLDEAVATMLAAPLASTPGRTMAYSNDGYRMLAAIIERAAGAPFREVVRRLVFAPAGMDDAGFFGEDVDPANVAVGYNEWGSVGDFLQWRGTNAWNRDGSGSVHGSLNDLRAFMRAYTSARIVSPASVALMTEAHARNENEAYGYGWFVAQTADGEKVVTHGGDNPGYHTEARWYLTRGLMLALTTTQELYDESGAGLGVQKRIIATNVRRLTDGEAATEPPHAQPIGQTPSLGTYRFADGAQLSLYLPRGSRIGAWIGASGQSAVNLLQGADPQRQAWFAEKNVATLAIATAVSEGDAAVLRSLLSEDVHFFIDAVLDDFAQYRERLGDFLGIDLLGTRNEITGDDHVRTIVHMRFVDGGYDLGFTWHGEALYEVMTDTGTPYALMLPIAQIDSGQFAAFDFIQQRTTSFTLAGATLTLSGAVARRI